MSFVGHVKVCRIIFDSKSKYFSGIVRPNFDKYEDMDERRLEDMAYQYLCHLEEAKKWDDILIFMYLIFSFVELKLTQVVGSCASYIFTTINCAGGESPQRSFSCKAWKFYCPRFCPVEQNLRSWPRTLQQIWTSVSSHRQHQQVDSLSWSS